MSPAKGVKVGCPGAEIRGPKEMSPSQDFPAISGKKAGNAPRPRRRSDRLAVRHGRVVGMPA